MLRGGLAPDANASATLKLMREARPLDVLQAKTKVAKPVFGAHFLKMVPSIAASAKRTVNDTRPLMQNTLEELSEELI